MAKKLNKHELKLIYRLNKKHRWMEIINDKQSHHPNLSKYKQQKQRLVNIVSHIKLKHTYDVVDFGCGNGLLADIIYKQINTYTGIDFSSSFIQIAKRRKKVKKLLNCQFFCNDITRFSKTNNRKFDVAFAFDFSEHLYDNDFKIIFQAIKTTLKSNGILYIHTPNGRYILEFLKKYGLLKQSKGHIGIRTDIEYEQLLIKNVGFKKIEINYIPHYIKLLHLFHFLSYIPIFGKFFKARLFIKCYK